MKKLTLKREVIRFLMKDNLKSVQGAISQETRHPVCEIHPH